MPIRPWPFFNVPLSKRKLDRKIYLAFTLVMIASIMIFVTLTAVRNESVPIPPTQVPQDKQVAGMQAETRQPQIQIQDTSQVAETVKQPQKAKNIQENKKPLIPVAGQIVKKYGWAENQVFKDWRFHSGIDIEAPEGAPILAGLSGKVSNVYEDAKTGLTVIVECGEVTVIYGSLRNTDVENGAHVVQGDLIGTAGSFRSEPYSHLHLSIMNGQNYINPLDVFN